MTPPTIKMQEGFQEAFMGKTKSRGNWYSEVYQVNKLGLYRIAAAKFPYVQIIPNSTTTEVNQLEMIFEFHRIRRNYYLQV